VAKPTLAILGRPNVGKSTLFNRLVGRRHAIVDEIAGVTRDRIYGSVEWVGHHFHLIDTGGYLSGTGDTMETVVRQQAEIAGEEADLILFMVDSRAGVAPDDHALADRLRQLSKPVLLTVNKIDDLSHQPRAMEFYELGLGEPMLISALSGSGVGDLLDKVVEELNVQTREDEAPPEAIGLAIIGVPNVGKSSFLNTILKQEKAIVTPIPGTTRDSIDSYIRYMNRTLRLIDTAGLRRKSKVTDAIEYYSTVRTLRTIDECQVAIVLVDAERGFHTQDQQIMSHVMDKGKGLVVAVNKWDLVEKDSHTLGQWVQSMRDEFKMLEHYPLNFISILHNQRVWKTLETALKVYDESIRQISTSQLNQFLEEAKEYLSPPATRGKRIQIKYVTQVHREPPLFAFFCNHPRLIPVAYRRYLENRLRERFGFEGVPIKLSFRQK
jgi:GTP-binding protein